VRGGGDGGGMYTYERGDIPIIHDDGDRKYDIYIANVIFALKLTHFKNSLFEINIPI
jgi:hypothetical protein